jgi:hypothetical protein
MSGLPTERVMAQASRKKETLEEELDHVVEEARMVLPGIQALFGFQLSTPR